ncbi:hypothetical protein E2C01_009868 [Portunus trituberculatus]|uniref:Uncharacterized protein n=1 Tax=Portunus trituberculatus TaxID=210409 RepID=A0A5B7D750_PORTR|nr:hypothetical protein [Portunus trituberculatus]
MNESRVAKTPSGLALIFSPHLKSLLLKTASWNNTRRRARGGLPSLHNSHSVRLRGGKGARKSEQPVPGGCCLESGEPWVCGRDNSGQTQRTHA